MCQVLNPSPHLTLTMLGVITAPILQTTKLRSREVKQFAQGHTAWKWWRQDNNQAFVTRPPSVSRSWGLRGMWQVCAGRVGLP